MANMDAIATRWAKVMAGTLPSDTRLLNDKQSNLHVGSRSNLYSYGSHFELARIVKPAKGAPFFLLNGDTYSVSTSRHQRVTRAACESTGLPLVIIPHSALTAAGIELDSIRPVDVEPERNEETRHTVNVPGLVSLGQDVASGNRGWTRDKSWPVDDESTGALSATAKLKGPDGAVYSVTACKRGFDYSMQTERDCGACEGTGTIAGEPCGNPSCTDGKTVPTTGGWRTYDPPKLNYYRNGAGLELIEADKFTYTTYRHWLGGCVFTAKVTMTKENPCPNHEANRAAFIEDGSPHWCPDCRCGLSGSGVIRTTKSRTAFFVSSFDENESRALYFLAELPNRIPTLDSVTSGTNETCLNRPRTMAEALLSLAPREVKWAMWQGNADVKRQGDIFAVPVSYIAEHYPIPFRFTAKNETVPLDGTARHIAGELVTFGNGEVYARGTMRHVGGFGARGDHSPLKLGTEWHRLYRNLVPRATTRERGPAARTSNQPGPRAWTLGGRVD